MRCVNTMQNCPMECAAIWSGRSSAETLTLYHLRCTIHRNTILCNYRLQNLKSHVQLLACNMPVKHPMTFYEHDDESSDSITKNFLISWTTIACSRKWNVGPRDHPVSCTMGTGSLSWWVKRPGRGVDHPTPSNTEVNERIRRQLHFPSRAFMAWSTVNFSLYLGSETELTK